MGGPMRAPTMFCPWCAADAYLSPMGFEFNPCPSIPAEDRDRYSGVICNPRWRYRCERCKYSEIHVAKWWERAA